MNLQLALLVTYSVGVVGLGLWTSRLIRNSSDFFVAGRSVSVGWNASAHHLGSVTPGYGVPLGELIDRVGVDQLLDHVHRRAVEERVARHQHDAALDPEREVDGSDRAADLGLRRRAALHHRATVGIPFLQERG